MSKYNIYIYVGGMVVKDFCFVEFFFVRRFAYFYLIFVVDLIKDEPCVFLGKFHRDQPRDVSP